MKKFLVLLIGLVLCGCAKPLTNEQIIQETQKCTAANMKARAYYDNVWTEYKVTYIQCENR